MQKTLLCESMAGAVEFLQDLSETLLQFCESRILCDTEVLTDTKSFWVHSVVLAAASQSLREAFVSSCTKVKGCHFRVQLTGCDVDAVEMVLRFLYTGQLTSQGKELTNNVNIFLVCRMLGVPVENLHHALLKFDSWPLIESTLKPEDSIGRSRSMKTGNASDGINADNAVLEDAADTVHHETDNDALVSDNAGCEIIETAMADKLRSFKRVVCNCSQRRKIVKKTTNVFRRRLICSRCGIELFTVARLHSHVKLCSSSSSNAMQVYPCHNCNATFASKLLRRSHVCNQQTSNNKNDFVCSTCGQTFSTGSLLRRHQFVKHSAERPHVCDVCGKIYRFRASLSQHARSAHGGVRYGAEVQRRWLCDLCGKSFALPAALRRHTQRIHLDYRPHVCNECGKRCSTAHQLRDHVASTHAADGVGRPYVCSTCGAGFTLHGNLLRHARLHSNTALHTCVVCARNFRHRQNLIAHERVFHSGNGKDQPSTDSERHFCSVCGKVFGTNSSLSRHKSIHVVNERAKTDVELPHKCHVCGKQFSGARYLANHAVVHIEKLVQCTLCPKKFAFQTHCAAHCKKKHPPSLTLTSCTQLNNSETSMTTVIRDLHSVT